MKNFWKSHKRNILTGAFILVLAIGLRVYKLTLIPVFADEAIYIRWAQVMKAEQTLRFLPLSDGKQPLFMWLIIPFFKIFNDPLFAGRFVSVLSGIGTLIGIFVLTQTLFNSLKKSLLASFIFAVTPFSIFFDRLALADSTLSFFGVWTLVFAVVTVKRVRLDTAMLTGFFLGGAFLTKSPAIYFACLIPFTLVLAKWPSGLKNKFVKASVFVFLFTFTYLIALGMYNILRLGPNFQMVAIRNKDYVYPLTHLLTSPLDPLRPFLDRSREYLWMMGPTVLIFMLLAGIFYGFKKNFKETLILFAWGFLPIISSSEFSKTMTARYIYFSIPYIVILSVLSQGVVFEKKDKFKFAENYLKKLFNLVLVIFVLSAFYMDFQFLTNPQKANLPRSERSGYLEDWTSGYGIKDASLLILDEYSKNPHKKIVVGTEGYFGTLPDGLQMYLNNFLQITVIGVGEPIREVPNSLSESLKFGNDTYLVVNSTRLLAEPAPLGLKLVSSYPKAVRPDGTQESLLLFRLENSR